MWLASAMLLTQKRAFFRNATLQNMSYAMWKHVASHYRSFDRIGAFEVLSEPRDKAIDPEAVRDFYEKGCEAIHAVDSETPCMVGPAPYYKVYNFDDRILMRNSKNVIYTFDYFNPDAFVFGTGKVSSYGSLYPCATLYDGWVAAACPSWNISSDQQKIPFNFSWHKHNFEAFVGRMQNVPVFMNQFEVVHGVTEKQGRFQYVQDLLHVARAKNVGFAYWTFSGGNSDGWTHGSSEIVFRWPNSSIVVDHPMLHAIFT